MNEIRFEVRHNEFGNLIVPIVDGKSLISILKKFELPFAKQKGHPELAGGYEGIPIDFTESLFDYYLGLIQIEWLNDKTVLLDFPCLCVGCWSFVAKIEIDSGKVIWKNFEQAHREKWIYDELGVFTFDRKQYETALKELENK